MKQLTQHAPWWQAVDRRTFGKGALAFATLLSMSGCRSEEEVASDSLSLQQQQGWNVGAKDSRLFFIAGVSDRDASGSTEWQRYTDPARLIEAWKPRTAAWEAFFVPVLMQSLREDSLRSQMRPLMTTGMREAFGRGETFQRDLLSQVRNPEETFFIADLPGPETVAFGAGMAGWADLIVNFNNWPHPWGVVRSHETLAAMLSYASMVEEKAAKLQASASGLLLLDNRRLTPYTDEATQFDNRYIADKVPSASQLQQRGVKHVMYIIPDRSQQEESDDLNAPFVEYKGAGIQVSLFPLADMQKVTEEVKRPAPDGTMRTATETRYYYGGGLESHLGFFLLYSLLAPRPVLYYPSYGGYPGPGGGGYAGRSTTMADVRRPPIQAPSYQPSSRPTIFSGARVGGQTGVGRTKPSGFGQTTVRTSGGRVTGVGRSGSFGRGGSGSA